MEGYFTLNISIFYKNETIFCPNQVNKDMDLKPHTLTLIKKENRAVRLFIFCFHFYLRCNCLVQL